jgi:hypothetical protein
MPIFALDSNRLPAGKTAVYWYDFISNESKFQEITRLKKSEISTFLIMETPNVLKAHYKLFGGKPANQSYNLEEYVQFRSSLHKRIYYSNLNLYFSSC